MAERAASALPVVPLAGWRPRRPPGRRRGGLLACRLLAADYGNDCWRRRVVVARRMAGGCSCAGCAETTAAASTIAAAVFCLSCDVVLQSSFDHRSIFFGGRPAALLDLKLGSAR